MGHSPSGHHGAGAGSGSLVRFASPSAGGRFSPSEIYRGRNVFILGRTGFVGKVLLAMLLDRFPDVGKAYVMVRRGSGTTSETRFWQSVVTSPAFDTLRAKYGGPERLGTMSSAELEMADSERIAAATRAEADDAQVLARLREKARQRLRAESRDPDDEGALRLAVARERKEWIRSEATRRGVERAADWGWPNIYTYT